MRARIVAIVVFTLIVASLLGCSISGRNLMDSPLVHRMVSDGDTRYGWLGYGQPIQGIFESHFYVHQNRRNTTVPGGNGWHPTPAPSLMNTSELPGTIKPGVLDLSAPIGELTAFPYNNSDRLYVMTDDQKLRALNPTDLTTTVWVVDLLGPQVLHQSQATPALIRWSSLVGGPPTESNAHCLICTVQGDGYASFFLDNESRNELSPPTHIYTTPKLDRLGSGGGTMPYSPSVYGSPVLVQHGVDPGAPAHKVDDGATYMAYYCGYSSNSVAYLYGIGLDPQAPILEDQVESALSFSFQFDDHPDLHGMRGSACTPVVQQYGRVMPDAYRLEPEFEDDDLFLRHVIFVVATDGDPINPSASLCAFGVRVDRPAPGQFQRVAELLASTELPSSPELPSWHPDTDGIPSLVSPVIVDKYLSVGGHDLYLTCPSKLLRYDISAQAGTIGDTALDAAFDGEQPVYEAAAGWQIVSAPVVSTFNAPGGVDTWAFFVEEATSEPLRWRLRGQFVESTHTPPEPEDREWTSLPVLGTCRSQPYLTHNTKGAISQVGVGIVFVADDQALFAFEPYDLNLGKMTGVPEPTYKSRDFEKKLSSSVVWPVEKALDSSILMGYVTQTDGGHILAFGADGLDTFELDSLIEGTITSDCTEEPAPLQRIDLLADGHTLLGQTGPDGHYSFSLFDRFVGTLVPQVDSAPHFFNSFNPADRADIVAPADQQDFTGLGDCPQWSSWGANRMNHRRSSYVGPVLVGNMTMISSSTEPLANYSPSSTPVIDADGLHAVLIDNDGGRHEFPLIDNGESISSAGVSGGFHQTCAVLDHTDQSHYLDAQSIIVGTQNTLPQKFIGVTQAANQDHGPALFSYKDSEGEPQLSMLAGNVYESAGQEMSTLTWFNWDETLQPTADWVQEASVEEAGRLHGQCAIWRKEVGNSAEIYVVYIIGRQAGSGPVPHVCIRPLDPAQFESNLSTLVGGACGTPVHYSSPLLIEGIYSPADEDDDIVVAVGEDGIQAWSLKHLETVGVTVGIGDLTSPLAYYRSQTGDHHLFVHSSTGAEARLERLRWFGNGFFESGDVDIETTEEIKSAAAVDRDGYVYTHTGTRLWRITPQLAADYISITDPTIKGGPSIGNGIVCYSAQDSVSNKLVFVGP